MGPYVTADQDTLLSIWLEASAYAHPFLSEEQTTEAHDLIRDVFLDMAETYMVEVNGEAVGFVSLLENTVGGLFLRPAHHGKGLGRAMLDHAVALKGSLDLDVFSSNTTAKSFYEAYGFKAGKERISEHFGHPELPMHYDPD